MSSQILVLTNINIIIAFSPFGCFRQLNIYYVILSLSPLEVASEMMSSGLQVAYLRQDWTKQK